ncbi:acyl-CoA dehydrogenase family protein [Paenisporosarcina sp. TG-14]|uniref:acyl-CoA dehydrogenase family protein n=1 Tax=Paenisporosarcina sp. TG-14 TaxID=1231057 RepID=UPI0002ECB0CD|nr:acyl-CoA dehydrogenase family protein [Paenisporosarcina sp. TG-14]
MSEMLEYIVDATNKILKKHVTKELVDASEKGEWSDQLWDVLVESGLVSVGIEEDLGGTGGDATDGFAILRLAGKYAAPVPIFETIIAGWLLAEYKVETTYEPISFIINFKNDLKSSDIVLKQVPWGRHVKKVVYIGKINGVAKIAILPTEHATVKPNQNLAGEPLDNLHFNGINLEKLTQFDVDQQEIFKKVMTLAALGKSAMMSGAMEQVLDMSVFYAGERQQFGRPIGKFQAVQHHLSALTAETAVVLAALNYAIVAFQEGTIKEELPLAKMKISESAGIVAGIAHQLHGAIGMTHEHQLHQLSRRLWAWREDYGNESYWAKKLAKTYIEDNNLTLWEFITNEKRGNVNV